MKKFLNAKNIIATIAILMAIIGGTVYGLHAPKADADTASEAQTKVSAAQQVEKKAIDNQVKKVVNEKKIHASESTIHVGQPTTNNGQFGRTLNTYCSIPIKNDSDWAIEVTVKFTVTVYDSAWKREITHEEIVKKVVLSHSADTVEFQKSYSTSEFVSGRYDILAVKEIFGKGVN